MSTSTGMSGLDWVCDGLFTLSPSYSLELQQNAFTLADDITLEVVASLVSWGKVGSHWWFSHRGATD